jgi:mannose-6-phosphate isomerase-like protein (cupin superfamily)
MTNSDDRYATVDSAESFSDLREHWGETKAKAKISQVADAPKFNVAGQIVHMLISGEESAGRVCVFEMCGPPGSGAPPHHQTTEDEHFYVLEGEWEFVVGDETRVAGPGTFLYAPRHVTHAFTVVGNKPGRCLSWNAPAGLERFFREMEPLIEARRMDEVVEKAAKYEVFF